MPNEEQEEFESCLCESCHQDLNLPNTRTIFFHPISFLIIGSILLALFWCAKADFFDTPTEVQEARESYFAVKQQFYSDHLSWSAEWANTKRKIQECLAKEESQELSSLLDTITPQLLLAFLTDELGIDEARLDAVSVMPKQCGSTFTVMVSKPEPTVWPFTAMLTLEIECQIARSRVTLVCTRLRRGAQELSPKLTWAYFGSDLEPLKRFQSISITTP